MINYVTILKKKLIFYAFIFMYYIFQNIRKQDRNIISSVIQYTIYYMNIYRIKIYITILNYN